MPFLVDMNLYEVETTTQSYTDLVVEISLRKDPSIFLIDTDTKQLVRKNKIWQS